MRNFVRRCSVFTALEDDRVGRREAKKKRDCGDC